MGKRKGPAVLSARPRPPLVSRLPDVKTEPSLEPIGELTQEPPRCTAKVPPP
jgi:hypothetical protein